MRGSARRVAVVETYLGRFRDFSLIFEHVSLTFFGQFGELETLNLQS